MASIPDKEYEALKEFIGLFYDWYMAKPDSSPEVHPLRVAEKIESKSRSNAKKGLQMAINDCVEMSSDWTPEKVAAADARFKENNSITLTEIRRTYSKQYSKLLKRGLIKSEEEYYLLKGIADGGGLESAANEAQQIEAMLSDYENKIIVS